MPNPKKSSMMDALYGQDVAQMVYDRCQTLSPKFNELVQEVVYDVFWARPGLSLKEKSLVTILTLITLNKEEQLRIHLGGFFQLGGTPNFIVQVIQYMATCHYINSSDKALKLLSEVTQEQGFKFEIIDDLTLSAREKELIDLVSHIALSDPSKTHMCMSTILKTKNLSEEEIENIMLHEMVYSGFPCAMNGFAIMQEILAEKKTLS